MGSCYGPVVSGPRRTLALSVVIAGSIAMRVQMGLPATTTGSASDLRSPGGNVKGSDTFGPDSARPTGIWGEWTQGRPTEDKKERPGWVTRGAWSRYGTGAAYRVLSAWLSRGQAGVSLGAVAYS